MRVIQDHRVTASIVAPPVALALARHPMVDADGWPHTGDVATIAADGVLRITDRIKELIMVKGFQVAPAELEACCAPIPRSPTQRWSASPMRPPARSRRPSSSRARRSPPDDLMAWLAERVAPHKRVGAVEFVDQIPKLPSGKILRRLLRDGAPGQPA
jgi:acyl-CoA synthetase (AMP-forming)/AMP-acid ligase II